MPVHKHFIQLNPLVLGALPIFECATTATTSACRQEVNANFANGVGKEGYKMNEESDHTGPLEAGHNKLSHSQATFDAILN